MPGTLIYRPEAEKDIEEIEGYYDNISSKITGKFFKDFFLTLKYIKLGPKNN
jgi:plasmid stabilization system protein ParE